MGQNDLRNTYLARLQTYQQDWEGVDLELYQLCTRRGHVTYDDVFTKVAIINRVYQAGLTRSLGKGAESKVASVFIAQTIAVQNALASLSQLPDFSTATAGVLVIEHGAITSMIAGTESKWVASFVSKYLHFHCPIVPIYDSRVVENIRTYVPRPRLRNARAAFPAPGTSYSTSYYEYLVRFLNLYQRLSAAGLGAALTVKGTDAMLW